MVGCHNPTSGSGFVTCDDDRGGLVFLDCSRRQRRLVSLQMFHPTTIWLLNVDDPFNDVVAEMQWLYLSELMGAMCIPTSLHLSVGTYTVVRTALCKVGGRWETSGNSLFDDA